MNEPQTNPVPRRGYVLVTPARNEGAFLRETMRSVVRQTIQPVEWIVVSDGSTDETDSIVGEFAATHPWIRLLRSMDRGRHDFSSVSRILMLGISNVLSRNHGFVGFLDADLSLVPDHFEQLIRCFDRDPLLGIAGGRVVDPDGSAPPFSETEVPGAVQLLRRECWENLGGLIPIPEGGWDAATCAMARMKGHRTRLFTQPEVRHLKPRNVSQGGILRRKWQMGTRDHALGYHPLFEFLKCARRAAEPPKIAGAAAWFAGYCAAAARGSGCALPAPLARHMRKEQLARIASLVTPKRSGRKSSAPTPEETR